MGNDIFVGLLPVGTLSFLFLMLLLLLVILTQYYSYRTYRMLEKVNTNMLAIIKNRVDASLLDYGIQDQKPLLPISLEFRQFKEAFDILNHRVKLRNGFNLFTNVEDKGDGLISVTASNVWLTGPREAKKSHLQTIYTMWKAVNCELPVEVHINDSLGNRVMSSTDRLSMSASEKVPSYVYPLIAPPPEGVPAPHKRPGDNTAYGGTSLLT